MNGSPCKGHAVLPKTLTVNYSSRAKLVSMLGTNKDYQYYTTGNLTEDRAAEAMVPGWPQLQHKQLACLWYMRNCKILMLIFIPN